MRRVTRFLTLVIVAFSLTVGVVPRVGAAESGSDVVFDGSGWGHGVGMSQYGAYGMAKDGFTSDQIIAHYYKGATVTAIATSPIWVNLERDFQTLQLSVGSVGATPGAPVTITSAAGPLSALPGAVITITLTAPGCSVSLVNPGTPAVLITDPACAVDFHWYEWSTAGQTPTTKVGIVGCLLADWNMSPTIHRPCEYARGTLHLRTGPGGLDLSAEMLIDDYVSGTSEMPSAWTAAALEAQAIASRSYAVARQLERGPVASNSCDGWCHVKDTTADQRYVGWGHGNNTAWLAAVQATAGEVVHHPSAPNGAGVVTAYFSSSSGGNTENIHEMFGGVPRTYLSSVDDSVAVDGTVPNPKASWQTAVSSAVVAQAAGLDLLLGVKIIETRTGSGSAALLEFSGLSGGQLVTVEKTGFWTRTNFGLFSESFTVSYTPPVIESDEVFFYRSTDGVFAYYNSNPNGVLGSLVKSGSYSKGWDSITAVDLDGDTQDEAFFYRSADGVFKYYGLTSSGSLVGPLRSGTYSKGWDSITAVDVNGDGHDEQFFYRSTDGVFKYYGITPSGALVGPLSAGTYSKGWDSITAIDLNGDGRDEQFFYRSSDGVFKYYEMKSDGSLGTLLSSGTYSKGWDSITAADLDGDGKDEQFFYRSSDGIFKYYAMNPSGSLGSLLSSGTYSTGWDSITAIQLDN